MRGTMPRSPHGSLLFIRAGVPLLPTVPWGAVSEWSWAGLCKPSHFRGLDPGSTMERWASALASYCLRFYFCQGLWHQSCHRKLECTRVGSLFWAYSGSQASSHGVLVKVQQNNAGEGQEQSWPHRKYLSQFHHHYKSLKVWQLLFYILSYFFYYTTPPLLLLHCAIVRI